MTGKGTTAPFLLFGSSYYSQRLKGKCHALMEYPHRAQVACQSSHGAQGLTQKYMIGFLNIINYLFMVILSFRCSEGTFPSCGEWGCSLVTVSGLLIGLTLLLWNVGSRVCGLQ